LWYFQPGLNQLYILLRGGVGGGGGGFGSNTRTAHKDVDYDGFLVHDLCVQLRCVGSTYKGYVKRVFP
jgi:hypothetical protein